MSSAQPRGIVGCAQSGVYIVLQRLNVCCFLDFPFLLLPDNISSVFHFDQGSDVWTKSIVAGSEDDYE